MKICEISMKLIYDKYGKLYLTKKEIAKEFSVTPATIDRMRKTGDVKGTKVMGQIMFHVSELVNYGQEEGA